MKKEQWVDLVGFEGKYKISDFGRILSLSREVTIGSNKRIIPERILRQQKDKNGYYRVCLSKNCTQNTFIVHRLMLESFVGPANGRLVLHNIPVTIEHCDNSLSNLRYGSPSDNNLQCSRDGNNPLRKLSDEDVVEIKELLLSGDMYQTAIARKFKVHSATISAIACGLTHTKFQTAMATNPVYHKATT